MIRVVKRYESRKLYDTEESRYISLEDIAKWVRDGQEVKVVDNANSADVSAQVLTQIILDEGKRGTSFLPSELLHELVRAGEKAVSTGVEQVQGKVDRLVQSSIDRLAPVRRAREEMSVLRDRLAQLENTLVSLESTPTNGNSAAAKKTTTRKTTKASTAKAKAKTAAKPAAKKTAAKPATAKSAATKTAAKPAARKKATTKTATTKTAAAKTTARKTAAAKTAATKAAAKTTETQEAAS